LDSFVVQASYDIVDILAATINEAVKVKEPGSSWSGQELAQKMSNRTFLGLTTGDVYISSTGERYLDLDVFGFATNTNTMQVCAIVIKNRT
jgi:ABC-type branched-subunit amino acid transport system substrate-binding protein